VMELIRLACITPDYFHTGSDIWISGHEAEQDETQQAY
jgi:hypothetical protein